LRHADLLPAAVARPEPGEVDPLQGTAVESGAGALRGGLPRSGLLRHAAGHHGGHPHLAGLHAALLRVLPVDALVLPLGQDPAGSRTGDGMKGLAMHPGRLIACLLLAAAPLAAPAAESGWPLDRLPADVRPDDPVSLQRGAQ